MTSPQRTRVTHTPCAQPVDLTNDNHLLNPTTGHLHQCPITDGPYSVIRWGTKWSVENILDRHAKQPRYLTQHEAQAEADRRNRADQAARTPKPAQPDLFSHEEHTA